MFNRVFNSDFGFFLTLLVPIALSVIVGNAYMSYQCGNYAQITGIETRYASFDTCYIKTAQGFQRWDEYKARAIASEGLGNDRHN